MFVFIKEAALFAEGQPFLYEAGYKHLLWFSAESNRGSGGNQSLSEQLQLLGKYHRKIFRFSIEVPTSNRFFHGKFYRNLQSPKQLWAKCKLMFYYNFLQFKAALSKILTLEFFH